MEPTKALLDGAPTKDELHGLLQDIQQADSPARRLTQNDSKGLGRGSFYKPWVAANADANEWKASLIEDWKAWIVPASLLMTVSFSMVFHLEDEMIHPSDLDNSAKDWMQYIIAHVYIVCMSSSAMLALKSINDNSQKILFAVHTPASLLPQAKAYERSYKDHQPIPWSRWLLHKLTGGVEGAKAYKLSIDLLWIGLSCGAFLRYGVSFALVIAVPLWVISIDMRYEGNHSFMHPWNSFVEELVSAERGAAKPGPPEA